uniref:Uncharacterized protein n=1 Tax=viral metagenome TaxID=1070528 RepID=A0A6C0I4V6_9ZZZZ
MSRLWSLKELFGVWALGRVGDNKGFEFTIVDKTGVTRTLGQIEKIIHEDNGIYYSRFINGGTANIVETTENGNTTLTVIEKDGKKTPYICDNKSIANQPVKSTGWLWGGKSKRKRCKKRISQKQENESMQTSSAQIINNIIFIANIVNLLLLLLLPLLIVMHLLELDSLLLQVR